MELKLLSNRESATIQKFFKYIVNGFAMQRSGVRSSSSTPMFLTTYSTPRGCRFCFVYPQLTPEQQTEAEYYLLRYLAVVKRIFERVSHEKSETLART